MLAFGPFAPIAKETVDKATDKFGSTAESV